MKLNYLSNQYRDNKKININHSYLVEQFFNYKKIFNKIEKKYLDLERSFKKNSQFIRDIFIDKVFEYAIKDKDLFFTTPDMGAPSLEEFRKQIPNQFIHSEICEKHMISMIAGLTLMKKKIICYAMRHL